MKRFRWYRRIDEACEDTADLGDKVLAGRWSRAGDLTWDIRSQSPGGMQCGCGRRAEEHGLLQSDGTKLSVCPGDYIVKVNARYRAYKVIFAEGEGFENDFELDPKYIMTSGEMAVWSSAYAQRIQRDPGDSLSAIAFAGGAVDLLRKEHQSRVRDQFGEDSVHYDLFCQMVTDEE